MPDGVSAVACRTCGRQIALDEFLPWPGKPQSRAATCPECATVQSLDSFDSFGA
jgi:hypothetical protein